MTPRLYVVSMFRDQTNANRRQLWLDPSVLRRALSGSANAQRQVILNVANIFRTNPAPIAWDMLRFTLLPALQEENFLG